MTEAETIHFHKGRRKQVMILALSAIAVGLVVAAGLTTRYYTTPERIRAAAEAYLQRYAPGRVSVGLASFSWLDGIRLFDVAVADTLPRLSRPEAPPAVAAPSPFFTCREVRLTTELLPTAVGRLSIESIVAFEPTCTIVRDAADGRTNLAGLLEKASSLSAAETVSWPIIELRDARIRVIARDRERTRAIEDVSLTLRGRSSYQRYYDIVWREGGDRAATGRSQIDLRTGRIRNIHGGLPWMSLEAVMIAINARYDAAGTWCDLLGLDGTVRAKDYNLGGDDDVARSATIELHEASISVPVDDEEESLAPHQRYLRFERVFGTFELTAEGITAEFDGVFHESQCRVSATMSGGVTGPANLNDVDLDVRFSASDLELPNPGPDGPPEEGRFIRRWRRLGDFYRDYDPHGVVDVDIELAKSAGLDQPISVRRILLTAKGADASYRLFPYRVTNIGGSVEVTPSGVFLRVIQGHHGGGAVSVDGRLSGADHGCAAELQIRGSGIPIDDALVTAVPERFRKIHRRLRPEGRVNVVLDLARPKRPDGTPGRWTWKPTISFEDLSASYVDFPYPLHGLSGTIAAEPDRLQVLGVTGSAGEARVALHGTVVIANTHTGEFDLAVSARNVPFDDVLLAALPENLRARVLAFHPRGRFDLETSLTRTAEANATSHSSEVSLSGVSIRHDRFPVEIEDIRGKLRVDPRTIQLDGTAGRYGTSLVTVRGRVAYDEADWSTELDVQCRGLEVDEALCAALPDKLRRTLTTWRVDGPVDVDVDLRTTAAESLSVTTVARIDGASVCHPLFPRPFENVRGRITFDESGARASGVEAGYGEAKLRVDFETRESAATEEGTIALEADGVNLDPSFRDILPAAARTTWDRIGLAGRIDLRLDRLHYRRRGVDQRSIWSVEGRADLQGVALPGVVNIRGASGTIAGSGFLVDALGGTTLNGHLQLANVDVLDRRLEQVDSSWSYAQAADGTGRLALESIRGGVYEGRFTSEVELLFAGKKVDYNLSAMVQGMNIEPFLEAGGSSTPPRDEPASARGFADARLYLSGRPGDPLSKRGGGRVEVVDGHMYRLPIMLAILHVINLSPPDKDAFDDASADFHIVGNRIELEDIVLRGSALALAGSGSMSLPDQGLHLNLVSISPHDWARLPGVAEFVEGVTRGFVELQVTGPLARPTVRAKPLPGISEEVKRLFKKKKTKKIAPASS